MKHLIKYKYYIAAFVLATLLGCGTVAGVIQYNTSTINVQLSLKECIGTYFCADKQQKQEQSLEIFEFADSYIIYFNKPLPGVYQFADIDLLKTSFEIGNPVVKVISTSNESIEFKVYDVYSKTPLSLEFLKVKKLGLNVSYHT